jgi:hypothetical protein
LSDTGFGTLVESAGASQALQLRNVWQQEDVKEQIAGERAGMHEKPKHKIQFLQKTLLH